MGFASLGAKWLAESDQLGKHTITQWSTILNGKKESGMRGGKAGKKDDREI